MHVHLDLNTQTDNKHTAFPTLASYPGSQWAGTKSLGTRLTLPQPSQQPWDLQWATLYAGKKASVFDHSSPKLGPGSAFKGGIFRWASSGFCVNIDSKWWKVLAESSSGSCWTVYHVIFVDVCTTAIFPALAARKGRLWYISSDWWKQGRHKLLYTISRGGSAPTPSYNKKQFATAALKMYL